MYISAKVQAVLAAAQAQQDAVKAQRLRQSFSVQAQQEQEILKGAGIVNGNICVHGNVRRECLYSRCRGEEFTPRNKH